MLFKSKKIKPGFEDSTLASGLASAEIKVLLTLTSEALVITDKSLKVLNYNNNFRELLGISIVMNEQKLDSILKIVSDTGQQVDLDTLPVFKDTLTINYDNFFIVDHSNSKIEIQLQLIKMDSQISNKLVYIWKLINITNVKQDENDQREFISVISHELRTPVAVIEASTSALLSSEEDLSPVQSKMINATRENALLLSKLLGDLSVYGKLQKGQVELSMSKVSPHMVLEQMQRIFTSQAEAKRVALIVDHDTEAKSIVTSEAHLLSIIRNFMSNALQFTQAGGVIVIASKAAADGVVFMVRDSGIGISPEIKEHIFDSKFHLNNDTEHSTLQGPGLGLYISARLAASVGATIWVESEVGTGSSFYIKVPMKFSAHS